MAWALVIVLYILGCTMAHGLYTMVEEDLEQQGMEFSKWGFALHVLLWPVASLFSLLRKDTDNNGLD